jgi:DNA replication factor GINS
MGFDDLRSILLTERETGKLVQVSPDIFDRTHAEIAALLKKVYAIEDPLSDEARALIEETIAMKETMHELFSIRSRKILALTLMHAEGNYYDREEVKRMLPAERTMFEQIAADLAACQGALLKNEKQPLVAVPAPVASHPAAALTIATPTDTSDDDWESAYELASTEAGGAGEPFPEFPKPAPEVPALMPHYLLVRVRADMDSFMGIDGRTYTLTRGDIVTLPERNAAVLSDRGIVMPILLPSCK